MDSFFGIGIFELVMIAVIALIVMGPERLPGAMREVGKYARQLRDVSNEFQSQFSEELKMLDEMNPRKIIGSALDPNSPPPATRPPATAATTQTAKAAPAAKPLATAKPAPPTTPAAAQANGDTSNSILPPAPAAPDVAAPAAEVPPPPDSGADPAAEAEEAR